MIFRGCIGVCRNPLPLAVAHPRLYNPSVTTQLDDLIARCTAQDLQAGRVMSAAELVGELKAMMTVTSKPKAFFHD